MDATTTKTKIRRLLRLGVSDGTNSLDAGMGELEMELALLREENARLKVERHRAPDSGRIIERMRHLGEAPADKPRTENGSQATENGSQATETAEAIVECLAIRDALVEACHEVQQAMQGIRDRLSGMSPEAQRAPGGQAPATPLDAVQATDVDLQLALGAGAPPDLAPPDFSQSAA
jgi:hypothetical protein